MESIDHYLKPHSCAGRFRKCGLIELFRDFLKEWHRLIDISILDGIIMTHLATEVIYRVRLFKDDE